VSLSLAPGREITSEEIEKFLETSLAEFGGLGERVLVVVPDDTRTLPTPTIFDVLCRLLTGHVRLLTFLVALGTHPPMTSEELGRTSVQAGRHGRAFASPSTPGRIRVGSFASARFPHPIWRSSPTV